MTTIWPEPVRKLVTDQPEQSLERLCSGEADGMWTDLKVLEDVLLRRRPAACNGVALTYFVPEQNGVGFTVGAHNSRKSEANAIRNQIGSMAGDGTLTAIATRWRVFRHSDSALLGTLVELYRRNRFLKYELGLAAALIVVMLWLIYRAREARRGAELATMARSQFLANMSHELRTPMNGVLGMMDLVLEGEMSPDQREQLQLARSSGQSLLAILNDILDFSRIDSGKLELEAVPFSIREVIERTARLLAPQAHEKKLELILDISPGVPQMVIGDPVRVQQVLLNLAGNAVKFTEKGEIVLRVQAREDGALCFEIRDTGIGIPPLKQLSIFFPFEQADGSISRRFGGSGLGLAISTHLARMMNGTISVESKQYEGSTFFFTVPLSGAATGAATATVDFAALRGKRILVADDNESALKVLQEMGRRLRMIILATTSAEEALQIVTGDDSVDAILCEASLKLPDGTHLAEEIRLRRHAMPIVPMFNSSGLAAQAVRFRRMGIPRFLLKPVFEKEMCEQLLGVFGQPRERAEPPSRIRPAPVRLRILVAEDNRINQLVARRILEKAGHGVRIAEDGREALRAIEEEEFDIALFDVQMPEVDGIEAVRTLRRMEREQGRVRLPVIAVTAHALTGDRERFLAEGMDEYVAKPLAADELLDRIGALASGNTPSRNAT